MALRRTTTAFLTKLHHALVAPPVSSSSSISIILSRSITTTTATTTTQTFPNTETQTQTRYFYSNNTCPYILQPPKLEGVRKGWMLMEDENYLYLRLDMPGFSQEDINLYLRKIHIEPNPLEGSHSIDIHGEKENELDEKESEDAEESKPGKRRYQGGFYVHPSSFKSNEIIWSVTNGVFRKIVPRVGKVDLPEGLVTANFDHFVDVDHPYMAGVRRPWFAKEEEGKGFSMRIDMPGLERDDVKVFDEGESNLVIEGEGKGEGKYEWFSKRRIRCVLDVNKFSKTVRNVEMENGVFLLNIPPKEPVEEKDVVEGKNAVEPKVAVEEEKNVVEPKEVVEEKKDEDGGVFKWIRTKLGG